jgi:hypothetical protein
MPDTRGPCAAEAAAQGPLYILPGSNTHTHTCPLLMQLLLLSPNTGGEVAETTLSDWLEGEWGARFVPPRHAR